MRPRVLFTAGAACAFAGSADVGVLGILVPRWLEQPTTAAVAAPPPPDAPPPRLEATLTAAPPPPAVSVAVAEAPVPLAVEAWAPLLVLHFASERAELDPGEARALRDLVGQLEGGTRLRVEGHADASGREEGHAYFSQARARAVARRLVQLGLERSEVSWLGLGASRPLDPGQTAQARARNRRVEIFADPVRR